jgi:surface antigen
LLLATCLAVLAPAGALAQSRNSRATSQSQSPPARETPAAERLKRCEQRAARNLDRLDRLGDTATSVTERIGRFVGASEESVNRVLRFGTSISGAIANRLNCREQEQAEQATDRAISGGVGTTSRWTSDTRRGVRGSSSVTNQRSEAGGRICLTVTDIVIVDGEETRAPKTMCRTPPSNAYVRV